MKDAKVTNWLAKRGKFDHATPADIYVHTASGQTESQSLGNVVGVGIPDGEMTTLLEGQNYDGPYGIKAQNPLQREWDDFPFANQATATHHR